MLAEMPYFFQAELLFLIKNHKEDGALPKRSY